MFSRSTQEETRTRVLEHSLMSYQFKEQNLTLCPTLYQAEPSFGRSLPLIQAASTGEKPFRETIAYRFRCFTGHPCLQGLLIPCQFQLTWLKRRRQREAAVVRGGTRWCRSTSRGARRAGLEEGPWSPSATLNHRQLGLSRGSPCPRPQP